MKPVTFLDYHYVSTDLSFPGGSVVKNPPVMQEMQVRTLGQEDPLEEGTATHSIPLSGDSCLENPMDRGPGWLQSP